MTNVPPQPADENVSIELPISLDVELTQEDSKALQRLFNDNVPLTDIIQFYLDNNPDIDLGKSQDNGRGARG